MSGCVWLSRLATILLDCCLTCQRLPSRILRPFREKSPRFHQCHKNALRVEKIGPICKRKGWAVVLGTGDDSVMVGCWFMVVGDGVRLNVHAISAKLAFLFLKCSSWIHSSSKLGD